MIDPITSMLAVGAGANLLERLTGSTPAKTPDQIASTQQTSALDPSSDIDETLSTSASQPSFDDVLTSASTQKVLEKLFADHPELRAKLGSGPYALTTTTDGTLILSSRATGQRLSIDPNSPIGKETTALMQVSKIVDNIAALKYKPDSLTSALNREVVATTPAAPSVA